MMHRPIKITDLSLSFYHKTCFENFSATVTHGARIAIIGLNGSGKSSLLDILRGTRVATSGSVHVPDEVLRFGYVPQMSNEPGKLSGGQAFNAALTEALSHQPNVLLLDEPTNHLDRKNRASLMRMIRSFPGTVIVVSHDTELLRTCIDTIWHIDAGHIRIFSGQYDDYVQEIERRREQLESKMGCLNRKKKELHQARMKEQKRASKSREKGKKKVAQGRWLPIVAHAHASSAEKSAGKKQTTLRDKGQELRDQLSELRVPEVIVPTFSFSAADVGAHNVVSVSDGSVGYGNDVLVGNIYLSIASNDRIAIMGDNGSGKSTLLKALLDDNAVTRSGHWQVPQEQYIGYLDQQYRTLSEDKTALETIAELVSGWSHGDIRRHLNDFLFRKNEEVNAPVAQLSGGERARLCLAQIAAKTPKLLILDEITNNLDLETKEHVTQVLKAYPGALIVVSHDEDFLGAIDMHQWYCIQGGRMV